MTYTTHCILSALKVQHGQKRVTFSNLYFSLTEIQQVDTTLFTFNILNTMHFSEQYFERHQGNTENHLCSLVAMIS